MKPTSSGLKTADEEEFADLLDNLSGRQFNAGAEVILGNNGDRG